MEKDKKENIKVLLVDDEEEFVRTLSERIQLRDIGSKVVLDGEKAVESLEEEIPDVMVLDLKMPGMNGIEVLKKVKEAYPQVKVVMLTGHGSEKDEEEARKLGAFDYLQKPSGLERIIDSIKKAYRSAFDTAVATTFAEAGEYETARKVMEDTEKRKNRMTEVVQVLLADDEKEFVETLAARLEVRGMKVHTALSGDEALSRIKENGIDVVILDVLMPGRDGIQTLKEIKEINPLLQVLMLTGHGTIQTGIEGMKLGAYDFLIKPTDTLDLVEKIEGAYRLKSGHEERIRQAEIKSILKRKGW